MISRRKLTVHSAASPEHCREMERKYGWKLRGVSKARGGDDILPVDCEFEGDAEFPGYQKED
jgi:hypothetical protein